MYQNDYMYAIERSDEYLAHYGVRGMRWGVRKAIASGNSARLGKQYAKAQKKLAKLEKRASKADKYKKRAIRYGIGAAAAGGLAAAGTGGVGNLINKAGAATRGAMLSGGKALQGAGAGISRYGAARGNKKLQALGGQMASTGLRSQSVAGKAGVKVSLAGDAVKRWGNSNSIGRGLQKEAGRLAGKYGAGKGAMFNTVARDNAINATKGLRGVSNNTIARIGAGAVGAGLAAASAKNAYRAATAQKKAQQFKSEMNKAFKGTQYANGNSQPRQGGKKRRRR